MQNVNEIGPVEAGIRSLTSRWKYLDIGTVEQPIFIFSAGWRSGSTALQRLVMSSGQAIIWGEPYGHAGLVQTQAQCISAFNDSWPSRRSIQPAAIDPASLSHKWVADFYPDVQQLQIAQRTFFTTLLQVPVLRAGIERWGFKEVRLTIDHAFYLRWLFPCAKFLFLYRNPYEAYRSFRSYLVKGEVWYNIWPKDPILNAKRFGQHWHTLTQGYISRSHEFDSLLFRFEDLTAHSVNLKPIEDLIGITLNSNILNIEVGSSQADSSPIPADELMEIQEEVAPLAKTLGYMPPKS